MAFNIVLSWNVCNYPHRCIWIQSPPLLLYNIFEYIWVYILNTVSPPLALFFNFLFFFKTVSYLFYIYQTQKQIKLSTSFTKMGFCFCCCVFWYIPFFCFLSSALCFVSFNCWDLYLWFCSLIRLFVSLMLAVNKANHSQASGDVLQHTNWKKKDEISINNSSLL